MMSHPPEFLIARNALHQARAALLSSLDAERSKRLQEIWGSRKSSPGDHPPKFDLRPMQRYILKRVFSLGWNASRFEYFDTCLDP
jgi:hypothetical protein